MDGMKAGAAKVDITPVNPCVMEGYAARRENGIKSTGVHDPLHARAFVVESGSSTAAIVSCDLCGVAPQTIDAVRDIVCGPLNASPEQIMILATHTHAGPVLSPPGKGRGGDMTDLEWLNGLSHKIAEALLLAYAKRQPARLGIVRGESRVGTNRRETFPDGSVWLGHATDKPIDPELIVVTADTTEGHPIARLVIYGCHATSLGPQNTMISGDYAGRSMIALEEKIGKDVVCPFINSGGGNVNPIHKGLETPEDPRAQEVVDIFMSDVLKTLKKSPESLGVTKVAGRFMDISLPRKVSGIEAGLGLFKKIVAQGVRIGDLAVVASPNEIACEIVKKIKKKSPAKHTIVAGYCYNAHESPFPVREHISSYLMAAAHFDDGGYEVMRTPYSPQAEGVYTAEMRILIKELMQNG